MMKNIRLTNMSSLEATKKQLELLIQKQEELYMKIKNDYDLDDEDYEDVESIENAIYGGNILLEWFEQRDVFLTNDLIRCQEMLVYALELLETGDKKSVHNANKAFETLVREARKLKKEKAEEARKAQEIIYFMNEIISVCDAHRQK